MIEFEVDMEYLIDSGEDDEVVLHDECGEHEDVAYVRRDGAPGDTSDGWHTFQELYEHRTGLLAALCTVLADVMEDEGLLEEDAADLVCKSRRHHDGTMYDGMFVVCVNCNQKAGPWAQWATWHCEGEWWDRFSVPEVDRAPEWDGHTPADALSRLVENLAPMGVERSWAER